MASLHSAQINALNALLPFQSVTGLTGIVEVEILNESHFRSDASGQRHPVRVARVKFRSVGLSGSMGSRGAEWELEISLDPSLDSNLELPVTQAAFWNALKSKLEASRMSELDGAPPAGYL